MAFCGVLRITSCGLHMSHIMSCHSIQNQVVRVGVRSRIRAEIIDPTRTTTRLQRFSGSSYIMV